MKEILDYIKNWGDNISTIGDIEMTHIYWEYENRYFCIISPHSGNDYNYILRINDKDTFNRWSNADEEYFFSNTQDVISYMIEHI